MLKTRVITALALLAILLPVLISGSYLAFTMIAAIFLCAAMWENQRLFKKPAPIVMAAAWSFMFLYLNLRADLPAPSTMFLLFCVCVGLWLLVLVPALHFYAPGKQGMGAALMSSVYGVTIFGCFLAMSALFSRSSLYFFSAMAVVWIADIGAYFFGKAFGRTKLAVTISPGKSWEGALGGWLCVLLVGGACTFFPILSETLPTQIQHSFGWFGFLLAMTGLCAASVVGDLFESLIKRRANVKDSSALLPGHGGVLDRIDALIPVLPLIMLIDFLMAYNTPLRAGFF